jgi:hypothetical protein
MQGRTDHLPGHGSRTKLSWSENSTQTFAEKPLAVRQEEIPRGGCNDPVSIAGRYSGAGVRMESVVDRLGDSASRPAHLGPRQVGVRAPCKCHTVATEFVQQLRKDSALRVTRGPW